MPFEFGNATVENLLESYNDCHRYLSNDRMSLEAVLKKQFIISIIGDSIKKELGNIL